MNVNRTLSLDVVLKVGRVDTTVTVEAENTAIQSSTAELGSVIAQKQVHDLPLNGRNFTRFRLSAAYQTFRTAREHHSAAGKP